MVRELVRVRSEFQDILIFDSESHGRVLALDGAIQITESDEFVYQEMLAHVPIVAHGHAKRVLMIGAGDGGVLRRVLQHQTVQSAVLVELDAQVIRLSQEYMPSIGGDAWSDPRATVIVGDGIRYVAEARDASFDVIVVDSTDPVGVGEVLFTDTFYSDCARVLSEGGIFVNQCGVPFMQSAELGETNRRRASAFRNSTAYIAAVPTYVGGFMAFGFASNAPGLDQVSIARLRQRAAAASILGKTKYWTPEIHSGAFNLPPYIADYLWPNGFDAR